MIQWSLSIIFGLGLLGFVFALRPAARGEASSTIDDSWTAFRYFNRLALFGFCFFWSWVSSVVIAGFLPGDLAQAFRQSPESTQALLMLILPVPLAVVFYWVAAKWSRRSSGER